MVARDLVRPDSGKQHDLVASWVGEGRSTRIVARHTGQAAARLGQGAAAWFE